MIITWKAILLLYNAISYYCIAFPGKAGKPIIIIAISNTGSARSILFTGVLKMTIKRGDIYYADLSPVVGSEQGGVRPVLVVQNDIGNKFSPTIIVSAITSQLDKAKLPTHIEIKGGLHGLNKNSVILLEQVRTIDKRRLREKAGHLDENTMKRVDYALSTSFGLSANATYAQ
jgi:mRNA interferase MazF